MANSATSFKLGEPIPSGPIKKIRALQTVFGEKGQSDSRSNYIQLQQAVPWIRMQSGVHLSEDKAQYYNAEGGYDLARRNVLFGANTRIDAFDEEGNLQGLQSFNPDGGILPGYDRSRNFGIRPKPGITGMGIHSHNRFGSLRTAVVNFQCWSKEQIDALEVLFMRPGYSVLLEWGHSKVLTVDDDGNPTGVDDIGKGIDLYEDSMNVAKNIRERIQKEREKNHFGYDAILGTIKNFSWKVRKDGGYDCSTSLVTTGDLIESYKGNFFLSQQIINEDLSRAANRIIKSNKNKTVFPLVYTDGYDEATAIPPAEFGQGVGVPILEAMERWALQANESIKQIAKYLDDDFKGTALNAQTNTINPQSAVKLMKFINGEAAGNVDPHTLSDGLSQGATEDFDHPIFRTVKISTGMAEPDKWFLLLQTLTKAINSLEVVKPTDPAHKLQGYEWINLHHLKGYSGDGHRDHLTIRAYRRIELNSQYEYLVDLSGVNGSNGFDGTTDVNFKLPHGGIGAFQIPWEKRGEIFSELREQTSGANYGDWNYVDFMIILGNIIAGVSADPDFLASDYAPSKNNKKVQQFFFEFGNYTDSSRSGIVFNPQSPNAKSLKKAYNLTRRRQIGTNANDIVIENTNRAPEMQSYSNPYKRNISPTVFGAHDIQVASSALISSEQGMARSRVYNEGPGEFEFRPDKIKFYGNDNIPWTYLDLRSWNGEKLREAALIGRDPNMPYADYLSKQTATAYTGGSGELATRTDNDDIPGIDSMLTNGKGVHPFTFDNEWYREKYPDIESGLETSFHGFSTFGEHFQPQTKGGIAHFLVLQWNGFDPTAEVEAQVEETEEIQVYDANDDYISKLHYYLRQWIDARYSTEHLPVDFTGNGFSDIFKYRELPDYDEVISQLFPNTGPSKRRSTPKAVKNSLKKVFGGRFVATKALEKRNYVYVQLRVILELINRHVLRSDSEYFFTFQTSYDNYGNQPKYFTFDDHYSIDPRVCILPHQEELPRETKGSGFGAKSYEILDIEVSIDYVIDVLNQYLDMEGRAPLLDVVQSILDGIAKVCGGQNEFDLQYSDEDATFHVVDRRVLSTTDYTALRDSTQINVFGLSSVVKDVNLVSKITPKMSSMIAISAQDNPYTSLEESTGFNGLNRGLTDRVYTKRYEIEKKEIEEATENSYKSKRAELTKRIAGLIQHINFFYVKAIIPEYTVGSQVGAYQNFCKTLFGAKVEHSSNKRVGSNFIIPFELQMTLYGISGIRVMDSFIISQDLLPRTYGGDFKAPVGFLVTGIEHHVDRNQWVTKIKSQIFNLGDVAKEEYANLSEDIEKLGGGGTSYTGECTVLDATGIFSGGTEYKGIAWRNTKYVPKGSTKETNVKILIDGLMAQGITNKALIIGILGTVGKESGFIPKNEYGYGKTGLIRLRNHFGWRKDQKDEVKRLRKTMDPNDKDYPKWCYGPLSEDTDKWIEDNKTDNVAFYDHIYGNVSVQRIPGKKESRGNPGPGDGWKFRGRGFNQITFKPAYEKYSELVYGDSTLIDDPDKLNEPKVAAVVCAEFMKSKFQYRAFRNAGVTIDNITNVSDGVYWAVFANHGGSREVCKKNGYKEAVEIAKTFRIV